MNIIEILFEEAVEKVNDARKNDAILPEKISLELYGFYKQACFGDCMEEEPGYFDPVKRYKWKAWKDCEGMDSLTAMKRYIELVNKYIK